MGREGWLGSEEPPVGPEEYAGDGLPEALRARAPANALALFLPGAEDELVAAGAQRSAAGGRASGSDNPELPFSGSRFKTNAFPRKFL